MANDAMGYKHELLIGFQELIIARDAYWKLVGDWKPDWNNDKVIYHVIATTKGDIGLMSSLYVDNAILAFPTEEMRDAFYENFKDLIEDVKELL